jgi:hypothetical protein
MIWKRVVRREEKELSDISLVKGEETYLVGDAEANSAGLFTGTGSRCGFLRAYHEMSTIRL